MIFRRLYTEPDAMEELGVYGACFKVAMVMMMFTYAFKFAYEPFVFAKHGSADCKESYADAMKYYVITALGIFLGMVFYMDVLQYVVAPEYRKGLAIIPVVLITYLFQGVLYNLSLWYKLTDRTRYGAYISALGLVITVGLNVAFVPKYSYWACVYASLVCYAVMTAVSYFLGQKYYPVNYPLKEIGVYVLLTAALWAAGSAVDFGAMWANLIYRTALLGVFAVYWSSEPEIGYIHTDFTVNMDDPRILVGSKDYVFVCQVLETHDYAREKGRRSFPQTLEGVNSYYTECEVQVLENLKGELPMDKTVTCYKVGGYLSRWKNTIMLSERDVYPEAGRAALGTILELGKGVICH